MPVGVRPHPNRAALAQSSSVGPLGMYGLRLQSLAPFGDDLLRIWACFPPSLGPDFPGSGPSPLGLFCFAQDGIMLCVCALLGCVFCSF